jgi:hypothetical protein
MRSTVSAAALGLLAGLLPVGFAAACTTVAPAPDVVPGSPPVLVGAGDIADCRRLDGASATARLLGGIAGTVFTTGDHAYTAGTFEEFARCYAPTWGRDRQRTRPTPGNHDYGTGNASAYFGYFGDRAGRSGQGYYSYSVGDWQIISLNSNISMQAGSPQHTWLTGELGTRSRCTLAYWHNPRFSSAAHGNDARSADVWRALYEAHADVVLNGHDHVYERFAPQTPDAQPQPDRGIRQFTVGTGGASLYQFSSPQPNSEVRLNHTFGVLKLTLRPADYDWEFIVLDGSIADSGTGTCVP